MSQIFPKEILENTIEVHLFKHKIRTQIIYSVVLISFIGALIALPFIYLDVYTTSKGIIKPKTERVNIISLYTGKVVDNFLKENLSVKKGDTLLIIDNKIVKQKIQLLQKKIEETQNYIWDLDLLVKAPDEVDSLITPKYQKELMQYRQKLRELDTKLKKVKTDYYRQLKLYRKRVIAKVEYLDSKYKLNVVKDEKAFYIKQQINNWQAAMSQYETELEQLKSNLEQSRQEQTQYFIQAPVAGTIQNLIGIDKGSNISAGTTICQISPDTDLTVECYVPPTDIGLLKAENSVKFQIDAFNYQQWGMASGKVIDISKDVSMMNNTPMFKVRCKLDDKSLFLKNGTEGKLKKGMTLRARFLVANRSLFDLLYDKVDDWFNPSKN